MSVRGWSLLLGTLFGIPVRVHFTLVLLVLWFVAVGASRGWNLVLLSTILVGVLGSILIHELAHALVARRFGVDTHEIVLHPVGGTTIFDRVPQGVAEFFIAAAGPLVNLVLAGVLMLGVQWGGVEIGVSADGGWLPQFLFLLLVANLALFGVNLLPAFPMDGGRLLRSLLSFLVTEEKATRIAALVGQLLAIAVALFALFGSPNDVLSLFLLMVAFVVFLGASQEATSYRMRALVRGHKAEEAMMTRIETLAPQDTLEWAARLMLATHQRDFPVVDAWGRVAGLLDRAALLDGLVTAGREAAVLQAMKREFLSIAPDAALEDVLRVLQSGPSRTAVVQDASGLLGMITLEKLTQLMAVWQRLQLRAAGAPQGDEAEA